jgi:phosphoserine phosphatase RsbU/P
MIEAVRACHCRRAVEMIDELMRAADEFVAGAPQHDDMTMMVVKVLEENPRPLPAQNEVELFFPN